MQNSPALGSSMRDAECVMANGELPIFGIKSFEREVKDQKWWALFPVNIKLRYATSVLHKFC